METTVLSALVLCNDPRSLRVLDVSLEARKISKHVATSPTMALEKLATRKFDLLIVDLEGIEKDWLADSYKVNGCCYCITVITIAQGTEVPKNLDKKKQRFILQKPLVASIAGRTIDAACNAILAERQPAFRYTINLPVSAVLLDKRKERKLPNAVLRNISLTGASIESSFTLPIGEIISLHFYFPETSTPFQATGKIIWSDSQGHCGIEFQQLVGPNFSGLRDWLASKTGEVSLLAAEHPVIPASSGYTRFGF